MDAVVLQFGFQRITAVAGDFRGVVAATELAATDTKLFRGKEGLTKGCLRSGRQVQVQAVQQSAQILQALGIDLELGEVRFATFA
ncbi:hypothetical protein D3C77_619810 [compost metagenome]